MLELFLGILIGFALGFTLYLFEKKNSYKLENELNKEKQEKKEIEKQFYTLKGTYEQFDELINKTIKTEILDAIQKTNEQLLNQTKEKIDKNLQLHSQELKTIITPFEKTVEQYRQKVEDFFSKSTEKLNRLDQSLVNITELNKYLSQQTSQLVNILHSNTQRGKWGEIQLKRIFEFVGLKKDIVYQEQVSNNQARPDFIINLPDNRHVIIDVKMPLEDYLKFIESTDKEQKQNFANQYVKTIEKHIDSLSKKQYWKKFQNSLEFVVLYLPIEAAFALAISTDNQLFYKALDKKIILASPSTIIPFLHIVEFLWRQQETYQNISQIVQDIAELRHRYDNLISHIEKMGKALNTSVDAYNSFLGSWKKNFDPQLRRIESYTSSQNLKPFPQALDKSANTPKK